MISQIFCFPYAGGNSSVFRGWGKVLDDKYVICPIEYTGRAGRFCEDYFHDIREAAEDAAEQIMAKCSGDYVLYGHSMGCFIALETAFVLKERGFRAPKGLLVGASRPPHMIDREAYLGALSKDELMRRVTDFGQMEQEVLDCPELWDYVSEILYADIQIYSKYKRTDADGILDLPIIAFAGEEDAEAPAADMEE